MALLSGKLWLCCTLVKPELNCTKYSWNIVKHITLLYFHCWKYNSQHLFQTVSGFRPPSATVVSAEPFSHGTGTRGACRRKWWLTDTDMCPCGETQTMSYIVESCPLTKLNGGLSWLHSADEDAVSWLTSYGSWHAYEKKKCSIELFVLHHTISEVCSIK